MEKPQTSNENKVIKSEQILTVLLQLRLQVYFYVIAEG